MSGWTDLACRKRVQVPGSVPEGRPGNRLPVIPSPTVRGHGADAASDRMGSIRGATTPPEGGGQTCGTTAHPITTVPAHADAAATAVECGLECGRGREDRART